MKRSMRLLAALLLAAVSLGAGLLVAPPAYAADGGYPYAAYNGPGSNAAQSYWTDGSGNPFSPYHYVYRNCTDFVAWKLATANGWNAGRSIGNAINWGTWAANNGYVVDKNPAVGAVAWWNNTQFGHVAYVTGLVKNTPDSVVKVSVEQFNKNWDGSWSAETINVADPAGYIHFADTAAAPASPVIPPGDFNHDSISDIYGFNKHDPGTGKTVGYVLDGRSPDRVLQTSSSPFGWADANIALSVTQDWNGDNSPDFVAVNKHDGSGKTVYYVMDGRDPERIMQLGATPFGWTDSNWAFKAGPDFNQDGRPEIYAFNKQDPGTGRTVIFVLDGIDPTRFLQISRTPFGYTDANWEFWPGRDFNGDGTPDLYAFNHHDPGTGRTTYYVLSGSNPEQILQVGVTAFGWTDAHWLFMPAGDRTGDGIPDFYVVNNNDVGSGKTVYYVLDGRSPDRIVTIGATALGWTDGNWDWGVW